MRAVQELLTVRLPCHSQSLASVPKTPDCVIQCGNRRPFGARLHSTRSEPSGFGVCCADVEDGMVRLWPAFSVRRTLQRVFLRFALFEGWARMCGCSIGRGSASSLTVCCFDCFSAFIGLVQWLWPSFCADASPRLSIGDSLLSGRLMCNSCFWSLGTGER